MPSLMATTLSAQRRSDQLRPGLQPGFPHLFFTQPALQGRGLCQHPVIRVSGGMMMTTGPIRVKQVNQSSAVIGHIDELASTTC